MILSRNCTVLNILFPFPAPSSFFNHPHSVSKLLPPPPAYPTTTKSSSPPPNPLATLPNPPPPVNPLASLPPPPSYESSTAAKTREVERIIREVTIITDSSPDPLLDEHFR